MSKIDLIIFTVSKCYPSEPYVAKIRESINTKLEELCIDASQVINVQLEKQDSCTYQVIISYRYSNSAR